MARFGNLKGIFPKKYRFPPCSMRTRRESRLCGYGTIRSDFAETIDANAVHGSDSPESAAREIAYFFDDSEIVG